MKTRAAGIKLLEGDKEYEGILLPPYGVCECVTCDIAHTHINGNSI